MFFGQPGPEPVEHEVASLVGQRVFGIALGYEDYVYYDELPHDPTMAVLARAPLGCRACRASADAPEIRQ